MIAALKLKGATLSYLHALHFIQHCCVSETTLCLPRPSEYALGNVVFRVCTCVIDTNHMQAPAL